MYATMLISVVSMLAISMNPPLDPDPDPEPDRDHLWIYAVFAMRNQ